MAIMDNKLIKTIIEDNTTPSGRIFDFAIQFLIILSLTAFALETIPGLSPKLISILEIVEYTSIAVFTIEYFLRILVADKPIKYILSFYRLIDIIAILPFFLSVGFDFRAIRIFRVFRIFRSLKLIRFNRALRRFKIASKLVQQEIILFLLITMIFIFLTASGIYYLENGIQPETFKSIPHSIWWSIVTLTTVGYGDIVPITPGGKVFTFFILIIGVGIVTVPAGLVATALSKARELEEQEYQKLSK